MVKRKNKKKNKVYVYIFTVLFSIAYIIVGRFLAMQDYPDFGYGGDTSVKSVVREIVSSTEASNGREIIFNAEILNGPYRGETVRAEQDINTNYYPVQDAVSVGDKVLIYPSSQSSQAAQMSEADQSWLMLEYIRFNYIVWLAVAFAVALVIFGRLKGVNTLISLVFTCLAVFAVLIPSIISGRNIYLWAAVACVYIIVMSMLFINGATKKSFAAGLGCFLGVVVSGVLTVIMGKIMHLTGMTSEDTLYLSMLNVSQPIDLNGIVFAGITIGALGAIMDVAMDIASALNEICQHSKGISAKALVSSGCNIGRDIMGTLANTLVLAYIGSSLCATILLIVYNAHMIELFNKELIIVELLQALTGSVGILTAIPFTALVCAIIYPQNSLLAEE